MSNIDNNTIQIIKDLATAVEAYGIRIALVDNHKPRGEIQDCDHNDNVGQEWVHQSVSGGYSGDDFHGTVTWRLGDFYIIADY